MFPRRVPRPRPVLWRESFCTLPVVPGRHMMDSRHPLRPSSEQAGFGRRSHGVEVSSVMSPITISRACRAPMPYRRRLIIYLSRKRFHSRQLLGPLQKFKGRAAAVEMCVILLATSRLLHPPPRWRNSASPQSYFGRRYLRLWPGAIFHGAFGEGASSNTPLGPFHKMVRAWQSLWRTPPRSPGHIPGPLLAESPQPSCVLAEPSIFSALLSSGKHQAAFCSRLRARISRGQIQLVFFQPATFPLNVPLWPLEKYKPLLLPPISGLRPLC